MKYYINENKEIFGIEQGQEFLIQDSWILCDLDEDGKPYRLYNTDGTPDLEGTEQERLATELQQKISEAKTYLSSTDYKMTVDYFATLTQDVQDELIKLRAESRKFIRENEA